MSITGFNSKRKSARKIIYLNENLLFTMKCFMKGLLTFTEVGMNKIHIVFVLSAANE